MLRRIRILLIIILAALAGACLGRIVAEVRRRQEAGEDPAEIDVRDIRIRPADVVPGLVAAVRVHDQPWSWLHIPSWLAAFGVNLAVAAVGGDLSRLREMAERAAFGLTGVELPEDDDATTVTYDAYATEEPRVDDAPSEPAPFAASAPATPREPEQASASASTPEPPPASTWATPTGETPRQPHADDRPTGFTPFRD